jgi:hypothetical protein
MLADIESEMEVESADSFLNSDKSQTKNELMNDLMKELIPTQNIQRNNQVKIKKAKDSEDESSVSIKSSESEGSQCGSELSENAFFNKEKQNKEKQRQKEEEMKRNEDERRRQEEEAQFVSILDEVNM